MQDPLDNGTVYLVWDPENPGNYVVAWSKFDLEAFKAKQIAYAFDKDLKYSNLHNMIANSGAENLTWVVYAKNIQRKDAKEKKYQAEQMHRRDNIEYFTEVSFKPSAPLLRAAKSTGWFNRAHA
jgi:hypothetical protein